MKSAKIVAICNKITREAIALEQATKSKSTPYINRTGVSFGDMLGRIQELNITAIRELLEYTDSIIGENKTEGKEV